VWRLRRHVDGELAGEGIELGHHTPALHGGPGVAVVGHALGDHMLRGSQGSLDVPGLHLPREFDIGVPVLVKKRRILGQRPLDGGHRGEHLVLDVDRLQGILSDVPVGRRHRRHRLSLVADLLHGNGIGLVQLHGDIDGGRHGLADLGGVLAGDYLHHPGHRPCLGGVDAHDAGMGVGAPEDRQVQHPGELDVVHVPAVPREQPGILASLHAPAHPARRFGVYRHLRPPSNPIIPATARPACWARGSASHPLVGSVAPGPPRRQRRWSLPVGGTPTFAPRPPPSSGPPGRHRLVPSPSPLGAPVAAPLLAAASTAFTMLV